MKLTERWESARIRAVGRYGASWGSEEYGAKQGDKRSSQAFMGDQRRGASGVSVTSSSSSPTPTS